MKLFITEKPSPARAIAAVIVCGENFSPDESVLHQVNEVDNTRGDYRVLT